jgi:hypothetical protein
VHTETDQQEFEEVTKKLQAYEKIQQQANVQTPSATAATSNTREPGQKANTRRAGQENPQEGDPNEELDVTMDEAAPTTENGPHGDTMPSTERLVDDLNMVWNVDASDGQYSPSNEKQEGIGHLRKGSMTSYLVRKGDEGAYSVVWSHARPEGYKDTRDVTQRGNRIIENIVQIHKDNRTPLPMEILSKVKIIIVYWESKTRLGHSSDLEVLAPDYPLKRPATRCFTYLDPTLYRKDYPHIKNTTGYSHETKTTMKPFIEGHGDWEKWITLYNKVVRMENNYENKFLKGRPGRPEPLGEIFDERVTTRRATSRLPTPLRSTPRHTERIKSEVRQQTAEPPSPHSSGVRYDQTTPSPATQQNKVRADDAMLHKMFLELTLELYELSINGKFTDLPPDARSGYLAGREKWVQQKHSEEDDN